MPAPSWVRNKIEAIAVRDVLHYLVGAAALEGPINRTFDIGSRQVLSYAGMMQEYAAEAGLPQPLVLALPVPAPKLAGLWVALTTPIPLSMSLPLVESLQHDAVSREHDIDSYIPPPEGGLTPYRRAVALALGKERDGQVETTLGQCRGRRRSAAQRPGLGRPPRVPGRAQLLQHGGPEARLDHHRRDRRAATAGTRCRWRGASAAGWTS